jgi:DeoR family transcriptional regulator, aga operon transcriptional repressor
VATQRITGLYTDDGAAPDALSGFAEQGVKIHRVPVETTHETSA